ncbi:DUF4168 domain-containing protein [Desulfobulbus alkaliphilus]|uniref:DUF4168 domain-containing protein n=1 Tax=Desulfobulbus alkaliphilus TaxID=869814 RepID=UPI0019644BAD|nr:DUF4168 domain-containing protein [Desulfobulbus alkaliphilus]MBM9537032.1 DUF4168 domain-containing protein [Desulfobulbus alkaliphilus]
MKRTNGINNSLPFAGSVLAILILLMSGTALAQQGYGEQGYGGDAGQGPAGTPPAHTAQDFSDDQLHQFVAANSEVRDIRNDYTEKLEGIQDQAEAVEIHQEMNDKMVEAVNGVGLDVGTYNAIANQVSFDTHLKGRVDQLMHQ